MRSDFYVYVLLDPRKPGNYQYGKLKLNYEPFYVGKGCNDRGYHHTKSVKKSVSRDFSKRSSNKWKDRKIKRILESGNEPVVKIIKRDQIESEAFRLEAKAIRLIGRRGRGPLTNLTDGGEGASGFKHSEKTKRKKKYFFRNVQRQSMAEEELKQWFANISAASKRRTPEEQEELGKKFSEVQRNLPEPVASKRSKRLRKSLREYRRNMTKAERSAESNTLSECQKSYWSSIDKTERQSRANAIKRGYASKDRKEIEQKNSKISNTISQQHASASKYNKRMRSFSVMIGVLLRNYVENGLIDPEHTDEIKQRLRTSATKFYSESSNLPTEPTHLREKARKVILQYEAA